MKGRMNGTKNGEEKEGGSEEMASRMAQQVKAPATKADNLNLIPWTNCMEGKN